MLDIARKRLRDDIAQGDSPDVVEAKVAHVASRLDEERRASLWLYAWHHAGGDGACPPSSPFGRDAERLRR